LLRNPLKNVANRTRKFRCESKVRGKGNAKIDRRKGRFPSKLRPDNKGGEFGKEISPLPGAKPRKWKKKKAKKKLLPNTGSSTQKQKPEKRKKTNKETG